MDWKQRLLGDRQKIKEVAAGEERIETASSRLFSALSGEKQGVGKRCPVCNLSNPTDAAVCYNCSQVF